MWSRNILLYTFWVLQGHEMPVRMKIMTKIILTSEKCLPWQKDGSNFGRGKNFHDHSLCRPVQAWSAVPGSIPITAKWIVEIGEISRHLLPSVVVPFITLLSPAESLRFQGGHVDLAETAETEWKRNIIVLELQYSVHKNICNILELLNCLSRYN
jgi:hypothetical protein